MGAVFPVVWRHRERWRACMNFVDLFLNLAGLLLWLSWRSAGFRPPTMPGGVSYATVLKPVTVRRLRRWHLLAGLVSLLVVRAWLYWKVGAQVHWVPSLDLGAVTLPFNSILFTRMALFSICSFGVIWAGFYLWLMLLSIVNRALPESDLCQRWVRLHLGWVDSWPWPIKLLVPWIAIACFWYMANPGLVQLGMVATPRSTSHLWEQGLLVGAGSWLAWKYLVGGVLFLHVVNSYLYLGNWLIWAYITTTARQLMRPLAWMPLRLGQIDFVPVVAIALVFLIAELGQRGLTTLFGHLPL